MKPAAVLITVFLLSSFLATDARLRSKDEATTCENEADFECEPGVCINASLTCNSAYDCLSMADETVQLCGCPEHEFRCLDACIPLAQRCDRSCDCEDKCSDEDHCDSFPCLPAFHKCDNHFCIPEFSWCDFHDDCGDNSDEVQCPRDECWFTQFCCDNEQCINSFFVCDGIEDCVDGSDESAATCSQDNFVDCGDGTRVHRHNFCDGHPDCPLNEADESNCSCDPTQQFQCGNTKCISLAKVCDGRCDCLECEDEADCDDCNTDDHIFCPFISGDKPPICLRKEFICDGKKDCEDNDADESGCPDEPTSGGALSDCSLPSSFNCGGEDGRCLPASFTRCDGIFQCLAGTDETQMCPTPDDCGPDTFQCKRGGECYPASYQCDALADCFDGSDEENCESFECPPGKRKCAGGHCIWEERFCDFHHDCFYHNGKKDLSDEANCTYNELCRDGEFRCRNGQCIDGWRRCFADEDDQHRGCIDRSHLRNCSDFVCPEGAFKCSRSHCVVGSLVCNRHVDCFESWDDEALADEKCSQDCSAIGCNCTGPIQKCMDLDLNMASLDLHSKEIRLITHFYLRGNHLSALLENGDALAGLQRMLLLDLSDNGITYINSRALQNVPNLNSLVIEDNDITVLEGNTFSSVLKIKKLELNGNSISTIKEKAFVGLRDLTTLDLSGQNLSSIYKGAFEGLNKLAFLDLSNNSLSHIPQGAFFGLNELTDLDISQNKLVTIDARAFYGLPKLRNLYTDEFRFCCMVRDMASVESCTPPRDEFSSCEDLMANVFLRGSIWVIGIVASIGNLVVIMMRMNNKRDNRFIVQQTRTPLGEPFPELMGPTWVHSFLITNLAIGDFCMGVYLLIIASVDAYYRGHYIIYDKEWKASGLCRFAGFLSTFSSELSVFSLTIITLHRLFSILFPFRIKDMEFSGAVRVMIVAWLTVIFLAAFPLTGVPYFGNFYGRSGVCLALHITPDRPAGWEYSVFIFLVVNFVSFAVIAVSYSVMFVVARRTQKAVKRSRDANTGDAMARRMTLIVMTDFVCWVPIILLGVASLGGAYIPPQVFAWIAVFILPVNSAVNPMLYTLLTAPYVRRVMSRARTSLNLSLATMTTDMKQVNSPTDRPSRMCNGRQGWKKGARLPPADANRNAIKLSTMISQSDTEPEETTKAEEFTLLRDVADVEEEPRADGVGRTRDEGQPRADGFCRIGDEGEVEEESRHRNV